MNNTENINWKETEMFTTYPTIDIAASYEN